MEKEQEKIKVCKHGLNDIWINEADGHVRMCGWTNYFIGNLVDNTIEELWNGEKAEKFRESLLDGSYRYCNEVKCPYCANEKLEEHLVDYNVPEYPTFCSMGFQLQCNYVCKFCRSKHYTISEDETAKYAKIEAEIEKMIPFLKAISANGAGELFCSDFILRILQNHKISPDAKVELETNGSLFNEKNWDKIKNLGNYDLSVAVTVHSFNEETYRFLSGTKLPVENIKNNLRFLSRLREEGVINKLEIATVVCERNFREIPDFVKTCLEEFKEDTIRLRFFEPYGVMDKNTEWFYDVRNPKHPYYSEFLKVMEHPVLKNDKVWKWQGEKLSWQTESPYELEHRNFVNLSELILLDSPREKISRYLKNKGDIKIAMFCAARAGRAYAKILQSYGMNVRTIFDRNECETEESLEIKRPDEQEVNKFDMILITQNLYVTELTEYLQRLKYVGEVISMDCFVNELKCI
jgi:organic radical activating enzyme